MAGGMGGVTGMGGFGCGGQEPQWLVGNGIRMPTAGTPVIRNALSCIGHARLTRWPRPIACAAATLTARGDTARPVNPNEAVGFFESAADGSQGPWSQRPLANASDADTNTVAMPRAAPDSNK